MINKGLLRWNCSARGCLVKKSPKWDKLDGCFPREIMPSDIDGMIEINKSFLFLEWKDGGAELPYGQFLALSRLTEVAPVTALIIKGNSETMEIKSIIILWKGELSEEEECDLDGLRSFLTRWSRWAEYGPRG
ncbi:MAG: hypothetical protein ACREBU_12125 [Nitrososphaera sp.]